jgi:hypothetical protein
LGCFFFFKIHEFFFNPTLIETFYIFLQKNLKKILKNLLFLL